ncbi:MAG: hypothetical protein AB8B83_01255 [Bdellovibrionales bacterium]
MKINNVQGNEITASIKMPFKATRTVSGKLIGVALTPLWVGIASGIVRGMIALNPSYEGDVQDIFVGAARDTALTFVVARDSLAVIPNSISCAANGTVMLADKVDGNSATNRAECFAGVGIEVYEDVVDAFKKRLEQAEFSNLQDLPPSFLVASEKYGAQLVSLESIKADGKDIDLATLANDNILYRTFG